jgi:hypothetical protein
MLTIPAHTSHIIQPLDNGVNGSFKQHISLHRVYNTLDSEKEKRICFLSVLHDAIDSCLSNKVVKHSWKQVGLNPFNPYGVLRSLPTSPPLFLNLNNEKSNQIHKPTISGKILVLSSFNYSFENLHLNFLQETIKKLEYNILLNANQKTFLEKYVPEEESSLIKSKF